MAQAKDERPARIQTGIQEVDPRHRLDVAKLEQYVRAELDEFVARRTAEGGVPVDY